MSTCPTNETFEAKKELKRVLRGYYKSDADPSKPKNFLEKALAKVNATVEAYKTGGDDDGASTTGYDIL